MNGPVTLTSSETDRLRYLEGVIQRGIRAFREVGEALAVIRDDRLYRATHDTFEDYCRAKWSLGRGHAYQLIAAASIAQDLSGLAVQPTRERQVRALAPLDRDARRQVWTEASQNGRPSGAKVDAAARQARGPGVLQGPAAEEAEFREALTRLRQWRCRYGHLVRSYPAVEGVLDALQRLEVSREGAPQG